MEGRLEFIKEWLTQRWTIVELSRSCGISRQTAYETIARYERFGMEGLGPRSRAPLHMPRKTSREIEDRVVAIAREFRRWGPRKLRAVLIREWPRSPWPSKSTLAAILQRRGVLSPPVERPQRISRTTLRKLTVPQRPNDVWATDFKGWALSGDRKRCEPLGIMDLVSRFAIDCDMVESTDVASVWPIFERSFKEYGLPDVIRSDNGTPFGSIGLAGLTKLVILFLKLGIRPERITPGKPQQNGVSERFNLTIQTETMSPMEGTREEQRRAIRKFCKTYNEVRPHEALDDKTPAEVYLRSAKPYPRRIPEFEYSSTYLCRRVNSAGYVQLKAPRFYLGEALAGEVVAFLETDDGRWSIRFGPLEIAHYHEKRNRALLFDELIYADDDDVAEQSASSA